jgi:GTP1/Obg family GTP-binding protein
VNLENEMNETLIVNGKPVKIRLASTRPRLGKSREFWTADAADVMAAFAPEQIQSWLQDWIDTKAAAVQKETADKGTLDRLVQSAFVLREPQDEISRIHAEFKRALKDAKSAEEKRALRRAFLEKVSALVED